MQDVKHKHIMLSVFSCEPQNSTQILKLNVAVALHLGDTAVKSFSVVVGWTKKGHRLECFCGVSLKRCRFLSSMAINFKGLAQFCVGHSLNSHHRPPPPEFEASGFTNFYETAENLSGTCIQLAMVI